ncbi:hypothetical protein EMPS_08676 [Entomortierella parvispora]|uniref:F-box domain-containing protein n=1 Tax=Entomortierella parvispora TaxID=205924 RepID=A0A9P3HGQ9_9FUNG|nr:hypothetical protein EMPS_08676 [Entomortierella parvispora]
MPDINQDDSKDSQGRQDIVPAVYRLAPEVILHVLSFFDYTDRPSRLLPILTLCKDWARLALILLYEEPVLKLKTLDSFLNTLRLQDSLQQDQKPFWDPSSSSCSLTGDHSRALGIDYRSLIKKPCQIVGQAAPTKPDLIKLWDLQQLLWAVPALQLPDSPSPSPSPSPSLESTSFSPSASPAPSSSSTFSRPSTPTSKPVLVRRPKRLRPRPGPVVMYLNVSEAFTAVTHYVLLEVPGMRLRRFNFQWHLGTPLQDILQTQLPYLTEISLTKPPIRRETFIELARLVDPANRTEDGGSGHIGGIQSLSVKFCQEMSRPILSEFAYSCGPTLQSLEIRNKPWTFRLEDNHGLFPEEGPRGWLRPLGYDAAGDGSFGWQPCSNCESNIRMSTKGVALNHLLHGPDPTGDGLESEDPASETDSRMDLALLDFAKSSPHLERVRVQGLTWLSDKCLTGLGYMSNKTPLKTIEILDSFYGCFLTLQGLLRVCGPKLEELVVDRKSCWRTTTKPTPEVVSELLCSDCAHHFEVASAKELRVSTGDRILWGLLEKGVWPGLVPAAHSINGMRKLTLIEHRVSVGTLKAVMKRWPMTLEVLRLSVFRCSNKELYEALITPTAESKLTSVLESITLELSWVDKEEDTLAAIVVEVFAAHSRLALIQINKRKWNRGEL